MEIREILATNLRRLRRELSLSQEELAHRANIDRIYVSALERCVYGVSIDVLDRIAEVLNVEAADLLQRPAPPSPRKKQPNPKGRREALKRTPQSLAQDPDTPTAWHDDPGP